MTERSDIMLVATAGRRKMWKIWTIVDGGGGDGEGSAEEQSGDWRANDDDANEQRRKTSDEGE